ncbi:MAG: sigma-70 family RNA polymerase sigma factor [Anaerolineales bacterium]
MTSSIQRGNDEWLGALTSSGDLREAALADLRVILVGGLRRGLAAWVEAGSPQLEALAEETSQEALIRILDRLDTFEGRSRFTTWAYKVAFRIALTDLRRKQWQNVSLDQMLESGADEGREMAVVDPRIGPEAAVERRDMLDQITRILQEELTARQMGMMEAVVLRGIPMEAIAQKMGVERNALYKMMHDARLKLKRRLAREGLDLADVMATFEQGNASPGRVVKGEGG